MTDHTETGGGREDDLVGRLRHTALIWERRVDANHVIPKEFREAADRIEALTAERDDYERIFDMQWKRDMDAVDEWRKGRPDRDLILPDRGDLMLHVLARAEAAEQRAERYRVALDALLDHYVSLANSGDCGNWDPEEEPEVIAARTALSETPEQTEGSDGSLRSLSRDTEAEAKS